MQPKNEYGYVIIDTEEKRREFEPRQSTDDIWLADKWVNLQQDYPPRFGETFIYRRRISLGDGFEIVPLSEAEKFDGSYREGIEYEYNGNSWVTENRPRFTKDITAFRRPLKQSLPAPVEQCPIAKRVADLIMQRAEVGLKKYGVNLARKDFTFLEWLNHLQTELLDAVEYAERLKSETPPVEQSPWRPIADLTDVTETIYVLVKFDQQNVPEVWLSESVAKKAIPDHATHWQPIAPVPRPPKPMTEEEALKALQSKDCNPVSVTRGWNAHIEFIKKGGKP